jgi:hypothetical protein
MIDCAATREAVEESVADGDTGCPLCGRAPEVHAPEREYVAGMGWRRRIDDANPCTCPAYGFDRDCQRHGDVQF